MFMVVRRMCRNDDIDGTRNLSWVQEGCEGKKIGRES